MAFGPGADDGRVGAALAALVEIDALHGGGDLIFVQAGRGALPGGAMRG